MTLENATQNLWKAHCNFDDPRKAMNIVIDKIFNDHEAQLKDKDEEIEKLKKLVNSMNNTYSIGNFDFEAYYAMLKGTQCKN